MLVYSILHFLQCCFFIQYLDEEVTDYQMDHWYKQRMSKQQLEQKPARSINLTHLLQYDQTQVSE